MDKVYADFRTSYDIGLRALLDRFGDGTPSRGQLVYSSTEDDNLYSEWTLYNTNGVSSASIMQVVADDGKKGFYLRSFENEHVGLCLPVRSLCGSATFYYKVISGELRHAPIRSAHWKFVYTRYAAVRFAPLSFAKESIARLSIAPLRLASLRSAWLSFRVFLSPRLNSLRALLNNLDVLRIRHSRFPLLSPKAQAILIYRHSTVCQSRTHGQPTTHLQGCVLQ